MPSPTSSLVVIVLLAAVAGLLVLVVRARHVLVKIGCGVVAVAVSAFTGAVL